MKVQDIVSAAVDETKFLLTVDKMRQAKTISTGDNPVEAVEVLGDKYLLNKMKELPFLDISLWIMISVSLVWLMQ